MHSDNKGNGRTLDEELASFNENSQYKVIQTLRETKTERTEKVEKEADSATFSGPFIRKEFFHGSTRGNAYRRLWEQQEKGIALKYCPRIIEHFEYGDASVFILEFVEGVTLEQYIKNNDLTDYEVACLFSKICDAVTELHTTLDTPLIHRDIKPTNIIVNEKGISLIDFGIARFCRNDFMPDTTQLGTPSFAPPEQYGFGETCIESDVYALGMVLYFMLTEKISKISLKNNADFEKDVPKPFQEVLLRATEFDPNKRFHSAEEFKIAISGVPDEQIKKQYKRQKFINILGRIWNILLLVIWAFLLFICIGCTVSPIESEASTTLAHRFVGFFGTIMLPCSGILFVFADKSRAARKFPWLSLLTIPKYALIIALSILLMFISALLSTIM